MNCKKKCGLSSEDRTEIRIMTLQFMNSLREKFPGNFDSVDAIVLRAVVESTDEDKEIVKLQKI